MALTIKNKEDLIEKVIKSKTFSKSETLRDLLKYLFQSNKTGTDVKAVNIAIDLLQRKGELSENDETIARVYVHKLRTKLTQFYSGEGKGESIIISIPKGKYGLDFIIKESTKVTTSVTLKYKSIFVAIITLIIINALFLWSIGSFNAKETNPVWDEFVSEEGSINLILANPFFYTARSLSDNTTLVVRNFEVNSAKELQTQTKVFPKNKYEISPGDISYFGNNNITSLPKLFSVIAKGNNEIKLYSNLNFSLERVTDNNTIAITSHKSIGFFKEFLSLSSFEISDEDTLFHNIGDKRIKYSAQKSSNDYYNDYAFIVKVPSPKGKILCIISDYHSIGNRGLMELITKKDAEKIILEQSGSNLKKLPRYFELLVKVSGYQEQNLATEVVYFKSLEEAQE